MACGCMACLRDKAVITTRQVSNVPEFLYLSDKMLNRVVRFALGTFATVCKMVVEHTNSKSRANITDTFKMAESVVMERFDSCPRMTRLKTHSM